MAFKRHQQTGGNFSTSITSATPTCNYFFLALELQYKLVKNAWLL